MQLYPISCPECGHHQDVTLYDSINVSEAPELRDDLLANRINAVTCESCGFSFRVDKPLLYSDPSQSIMIYWIPTEGTTLETSQEELFRDSITQLGESMPDDLDAPEIHLVLQRTELVERIFLLEAGLDERIIEYIKYTVYTRNIEQVEPDTKNLLFNAEDSTDERLLFVVQDLQSGQFESVLEFSREAYQGLVEMFDSDDKTPSLFELFPGPHINARAMLLNQSSA